MTTLEYDTLDDPDRAIRLLQVLPMDQGPNKLDGAAEGHADLDMLICTLRSFTRGESCPEYTALSYAWGQGTAAKTISINGALCHVNETVEMALREIRRRASLSENPEKNGEQQGELVWVDQICINQNNEEEKGHQVNKMRHIYSEASHVIAWLGTSCADCDFLFEWFARLGEALAMGDFDFIRDYQKDEKFRSRVARAYFRFCQQTYWTRLWVIQEYAVAQTLTVACGPWRVDSEHIYAIVIEDDFALKEGQITTEYEKHDIMRDYQKLLDNVLSSFVQSVLTRRSGYQWGFQDETVERVSLFTMLATALVLEADYNLPQTSDPRDRVFSLIGLTSDQDAFPGFPDYTRSCEEIYQSAAEGMLAQGQVDILAYCQFPKNFAQLPSWVPDWSMELRAACCCVVFETEFKASGDSDASVKVKINGREVTLQGVFVDSVKERSDFLWDPNWLEALDIDMARQYVEEVRRYCRRSPRIRVEDEEDDVGRIAIAECKGQHGDITWDNYYALIRDGLQELYTDMQEQPQDVDNEEESEIAASEGPDGHEFVDPQLSEAVNQLQELEISNGYRKNGEEHENDVEKIKDDPAPSERAMLPRDPTWFREGLRLLHSRRPFITSTGYVGLCPDGTEVGDRVFVLLGGLTPYMLRPVDSGTSHVLIGETYVHGIMYGEMLKGKPEIVDVTIR